MPEGWSQDNEYGQWAALANTATTYARLAGAGPAVELVATMAGLGDAQAQMLASIKKDTKLLREEPFRTARTRLAEARRMGPHDPRYADHIDRALDSFFRAHSLAGSARELAVVEFDIALLHIATGHPSDARHWLEQSRASSRVAMDDLVRGYIVPYDPLSGCIEDKRNRARLDVGHEVMRRGGQLVAGTAATVAVLPLLAVFVMPKRRRRAAIEAACDLVSLSNLIEHVTGSERGEEVPPPLEIVEYDYLNTYQAMSQVHLMERTST